MGGNPLDTDLVATCMMGLNPGHIALLREAHKRNVFELPESLDPFPCCFLNGKRVASLRDLAMNRKEKFMPPFGWQVLANHD